MTYGVLAWGYENDIIFKLQKRALRAVTSSRYNAHICPLFIKMKLLKVKDIHKLSQLKLIYKLFHRELAEYFNSMLTTKPIDIHDYSTRKRTHAIKDKVGTHSFHGFSQYVKQFLIGDFICTCHIEGCYICKHDIEIPLE